MSLTDSPDCLFRPEDKALKMLFPSMEESTHSSVDDFFDRELYELGNDVDNKGFSELDDLFANNSSFSPSPSKIHRLKGDTSSPQPWRKGLWCLNQKPNSNLAIEKTRKANRFGQHFVSPLKLISDRHQAVDHSAKTASTGTPHSAVRSKSARFIHNRSTHASISRDQTLSPSQQYTNLPMRAKMEQLDDLPHDFQNFHLQMPDNGLYLLPKDHQSQKHELALRQANANIVNRNATVTCPPQSPTRYHYPFNHVPRVNDQYVPSTAVDSSFPGPPDSQLVYNDAHRYADVKHSDAPIWTTESLHSSDSSHYSHRSQRSNESYQRMYASHPSQDWSSSAGMNEHSIPLHEGAYETLVPATQLVDQQTLYHQQQQQYQNGLGIHYPTADEIGRAIPYGADHPPTSPNAITFNPYPPLPPAPPMSPILNDTSPFLTPRRQRRRGKSTSDSPSPTLSPTCLLSSRSLRQTSPSRPEHVQSHTHIHTHTRRKSLHKPGPIKDTTTTETPTHRRTRSTSRTRGGGPRTPKTPRTPTSIGGFNQVDFVNFTPKDSAKLMSDVAPSGSSKTRARREQEARDRRKRMGEAALQAVMRVGGDVTELEEAIFT